MKTTSLYVGDRLRVLVNGPLCAGLLIGDIVEVARFAHDATPIVKPLGRAAKRHPGVGEWHCSLVAFFHHYKKIKGAR